MILFQFLSPASGMGNVFSPVCLLIILFCTGPAESPIQSRSLTPTSLQRAPAPRHVQTCSTWILRYRDLPSRLDMFKDSNCYHPKGKVMFSEASVSHSVHNRTHSYSVTANPCYNAAGTHPTTMF